MSLIFSGYSLCVGFIWVRKISRIPFSFFFVCVYRIVRKNISSAWKRMSCQGSLGRSWKMESRHTHSFCCYLCIWVMNKYSSKNNKDCNIFLLLSTVICKIDVENIFYNLYDRPAGDHQSLRYISPCYLLNLNISSKN